MGKHEGGGGEHCRVPRGSNGCVSVAKEQFMPDESSLRTEALLMSISHYGLPNGSGLCVSNFRPDFQIVKATGQLGCFSTNIFLHAWRCLFSFRKQSLDFRTWAWLQLRLAS